MPRKAKLFYGLMILAAAIASGISLGTSIATANGYPASLETLDRKMVYQVTTVVNPALATVVETFGERKHRLIRVDRLNIKIGELYRVIKNEKGKCALEPFHPPLPITVTSNKMEQ